ncbi:MAG: 2,3-bisphosphoglycerate-independent phosphoglycerate mutase [Phycisphaerae bacterium]|nr:2,3-bisphosphoglycerate-independent phosphoglycerate mutase [Phycisphaerae bacterium]
MPRIQLARRPLMLIVRDGWGHNPSPQWNHANAVHLARTPVDDRLMREYPNVLIHTSGEDVGLPDGVMGNSEVGHQNIGAGRIVDQEIMRISRRIRDGSFFQNSALVNAVNQVIRTGGRLHVAGLCSDAGVHSTLEHAYAVLRLAADRNLAADRVCFHAFGDGRDTPPHSGVEYIRQVESRMREIGVGRVCSVVGRYYAMDRDQRWDRVERAYRLLTRGDGVAVRSAEEAFRRYYEHPTEPSRNGDEFIEPSVVCDDGRTPRGIIRSGDAVVLFNFRGDRPRELVKAFVSAHFPFEAMDKDGSVRLMGFNRGERIPDLYFCTMCEYESGLPVHVAFPKPAKMANILGAYWADGGLTQFRCAETEKYPHVTYFFNDYREEPFDGEDRQIIPSPRDVTTYDQKPEMSAPEVTAEMLRRIASDRYDLYVLNYANGDMVGHTGVLDAAIRAVEVVDQCVGRVVDAVVQRGGAAIVTADHGNCEQMIDPATGGPHTAHTTYDVPLIVVDDRFRGRTLRTGGRLADIAPTLLEIAGLARPGEMTGESLLARA